MRSEDFLPPGLAALVHELLQVLAPRTGGDEERIGCVDDDEVVHAQAGDDALGERDDDPADDLFVHDCTYRVSIRRTEGERDDRKGREDVPRLWSPRITGWFFSAGRRSAREEKSPKSSQPIIIAFASVACSSANLAE